MEKAIGKSNKSSKGSMIGFIISIILIIALSGYIIYDKFISNTKQEENIQEDNIANQKEENEVSRENIDITGQRVTNLMNITDATNNIFVGDFFGYFYNSDVYKFSDMSDSDKLSLAWFAYENLYSSIELENTNVTDVSISEDKVNQIVKTIFGPDNTYNMVNFYAPACGVLLTYDENSNKFNGPSGVCGGVGWPPKYLTDVVEAYKENDEIIIFQKVLYVEYKAKGNNYDIAYADIYNNASKEKTIQTDIEENEFDNIKTNYIDNGDTYKFTFKKQSDGNYYFYSSELQNQWKNEK